MAIAGLTEHGKHDLVIHIVCVVITVSATILRMWSKAISLRNAFSSFHADDWLLVVTLVTYLGAVSVCLWGVLDGSKGRELRDLLADLQAAPSAEGARLITNYMRSLFAGHTILYVTLFIAKLSICMMYRRIFSTEPFRRICLVLMGISTAWVIATEVTNFWICLPLSKFLDGPQATRRFNLLAIITGVVDILLDVAILVLPIRAVLSLQMRTRNKVIVSGIFLLGGFSVITNILRIAYQYQPDAFFVRIRTIMIWSNIHATVTIVCVCLPVYRPLIDHVGKSIFRIRDRYASSMRGFMRTSRRSRTSKTEGELSTPETGSGFYPSYAGDRYPSKDSTMELVRGPGQSHYTAGARRSDVSGEEFHTVHATAKDITRTTKVEIV